MGNCHLIGSMSAPLTGPRIYRRWHIERRTRWPGGNGGTPLVVVFVKVALCERPSHVVVSPFFVRRDSFLLSSTKVPSDWPTSVAANLRNDPNVPPRFAGVYDLKIDQAIAKSRLVMSVGELGGRMRPLMVFGPLQDVARFYRIIASVPEEWKNISHIC